MVQWRGRRASGRVEDRRGMPVSGKVVGGGIGGVLLVLAFALLTGRDPLELMDEVGGPAATTEAPAPGAPAEGDEQARFVAVVLADTEDTWSEQMAALGRGYEPPTLVLFDDAVQSACGLSSAAVGPFYCPLDRKVYLDLSFFRELDQRFGAPGDFARAYVVAHEVGHHVQNLLGISDQVRRLEARGSRTEANRLSVLLELQADCFAGVFGNHERQLDVLDPGDVDEGLRAAAAIGDDRLQREAGGRVVPDAFTHGTSEQRARWLRRGLDSGDPAACDTFGGAT